MHTLFVFGTRALIVLGLIAGLTLLTDPGQAQPKPHHHPSHLHAALHELKEARHELREAKHDFGGHKEKALKAVEHAIREVEDLLPHHPHHKK